MNGKIIGVALALIIVFLGLDYFFAPPKTETNTPPVTTGMPIQPQNIVITYTDAGYSPADITIPIGATVTWTNNSSKEMWVASAMHPTHMAYDGSSKNDHCMNNAPTSNAVFDECTGHEIGSSWSFTVTKAGAWKYHDHITSGRYGSITVTAPMPKGEDANAISI